MTPRSHLTYILSKTHDGCRAASARATFAGWGPFLRGSRECFTLTSTSTQQHPHILHVYLTSNLLPRSCFSPFDRHRLSHALSLYRVSSQTSRPHFMITDISRSRRSIEMRDVRRAPRSYPRLRVRSKAGCSEGCQRPRPRHTPRITSNPRSHPNVWHRAVNHIPRGCAGVSWARQGHPPRLAPHTHFMDR